MAGKYLIARRARLLSVLLTLGAFSTPVFSQERTAGHASDAQLAGEYVHSQMELVAGIRLNPDGSFLYGLSVGSLDERASGRWKRVGDRIELVSAPTPIPPAVRVGAVERAEGKPFAIRLTTANGRDVPGVDFRIEFDDGDALTDYMPGGPWSMPEGERRTPRFITFAMPSYRLQSPRFPIAGKAGTVAGFVLDPNDFGVIDLTGTQVDIEGDALIVRREVGEMRFRRR